MSYKSVTTEMQLIFQEYILTFFPIFPSFFQLRTSQTTYIKAMEDKCILTWMELKLVVSLTKIK